MGPLTMSRRQVNFAAALIAVALVPITSAAAAASGGSSPALRPAHASAACTALILSGSKYVPLRRWTYRYAYRKVKGGKFVRVVVRKKLALRVSCAKRCVQTVKVRGKLRSVYSIKRVLVRAKKRGRIIKIRQRRRVYKFVACPASVPGQTLGVPIKVTVLPGSFALLDFGSFQRQAPVTGTLSGFSAGAIKLKSDIQVSLTKGALSLGQTPIFIDDLCSGQVSAAIRTGNPTSVSLDTSKQSTTTLFANGTVTAIAYTLIRLPLELRNGDFGCTSPYITTGYREFSETFFLRGKVGVGGLTKLALTSAPQTLDTEACLAPGTPTQPCNGFAIPLPILVSTSLTVSVDLSGK